MAMRTYARQGGTSTIFINDDGLRVLSRMVRDARIAYYANHGIGWVARPPHDGSSPEGFKRAGRFKKASNMNYGLALSLKAEKHLAELQALAEKARPSRETSTMASSGSGSGSGNGQGQGQGQKQQRRREDVRYGMQYQDHDGEDQGVVAVRRDEEGGSGGGGGSGGSGSGSHGG